MMSLRPLALAIAYRSRKDTAGPGAAQVALRQAIMDDHKATYGTMLEVVNRAAAREAGAGWASASAVARRPGTSSRQRVTGEASMRRL
jgi:hypothetical protein